MSKYFKYVKKFSCIFCHQDFPIDEPGFRTMNRHGWGCCKECWTKGLPNCTAKKGEIKVYEFEP